jgi:hypothetical protein
MKKVSIHDIILGGGSILVIIAAICLLVAMMTDNGRWGKSFEQSRYHYVKY